MKNLAIFFLIVLLASCKKEAAVQPMPISPAATGSLVFYSPDTSWLWGVLVDSIDQGQITRSLTAPACGDTNFQNLTLTTGTHIICVYSLSGLFDHWPDTINVTAGSCTQIAVKE